jgi:hypothetical protein
MKPSLLAGFLPAILFVAIGYPLVASTMLVRRPLVARLSYAFLAGVAALGIFLYAGSCVGVLRIEASAVWIAAGLIVVAGGAMAAIRFIRRKRAGREAMTPRRRSRVLAWLTCLAALAVFTGVYADVVSLPIRDFDGRMTWVAQARFILAEGTVNAEALRDSRLFITNPRYPVLLPVAQTALLSTFPASLDAPLVRGFYGAFYLVFVAIAFDAARRVTGRTGALVSVLVLLTLPFVPFGGEGGAISCYADLPLACFYGAAIALLLDSRRQTSSVMLAGLFLGAAALTKNEGVILAIGVAALWSFASAGPWIRRRWRDVLIVGAILGVCLALLWIWKSGIPSRYDESYQISDTVVSPERLALIARLIARCAASVRDWGIYWFTVPVVLLLACKGLLRRRTAMLLVFALVPLGTGIAAYLVHKEPAYLAPVTWNRLALQSLIPLTAVLAAAISHCRRSARWYGYRTSKSASTSTATS